MIEKKITNSLLKKGEIEIDCDYKQFIYHIVFFFFITSNYWSDIWNKLAKSLSVV